MSADLFISYRRADTGGHAGRLYDRLRYWFDDAALFYDLDGIDMGESFSDTIEAAVVGASVVLVVIGPDWLEEINRRVAEPEVDFVRREVELALARRKEEHPPVIVPVLMGGAVMPSATQFHEALQPALTGLCTLDAHTFQGKQTDWDQQFVRLRDRLAQVPGFPEPYFRAPRGVEQPFHLIGHSISPHFQDPNGLLLRLRQSLVGSGGAVILARAALFGMGGLGKTQLALKYSLEYRDAYAGVWWFRAETETTLQLSAQEACQVVGAPSQPGENPSAALNRWLERQDCTWLLVYDNAEDMAALRPHLPQVGRHHLIITSRNSVWGGIAQTLELDFWTPEQSADFLAARLSSAGHDDLMALAKDLGGLPLALEQAASYIEETACTVAEYRKLLTGIDTEGLILDEGRAATGYERTVAATLTLAFEKLSLPSQQLLRLCAYAAPEPLPECFFLQAAAADLPLELATAVSQPLAWNKIVGELRRYGLAERHEVPALDRAESDLPRTEQALSLHRLTQQTTRARNTQPAEDCRAFVRLLTTCCPADPELPESWPHYAALTPHVTQLNRYFDTGWCELRPYSWLLNQVGRYLLSGPTLYAESVSLLRRALAIDQAELGEEHPYTVTSMHNLAATLWDQGDLSGARALQEKVVEVSRRFLGEAHPYILRSMNNLASTLQSQGDLSGALALQEKVVEVSRRVLGEEHPDTLTSMNNLALTLGNQGDLAGARALQEKLLEVLCRVQGEEHPYTLTSMNNLAETLRGQGDLAGACVLNEKVLEVRRRVQGEEHPDTLTSMNNLALTLGNQGDLAGARILQEKLLEAKRRVQGEKHPETSGSAWNLFCTLNKMGEYNTAQELLRSHLVWLLERDPNELGALQQQIRERVREQFPHPENDTSQMNDPN